MNSAEKPFEQLSSHEQEIFKICGDIIGWKPEVPTPETMELRERATALFQKMREVDLAYDNSYYKYIAEAHSLKNELEALTNKSHEYKNVYISSRFVKTESDLDILSTKLLEAMSANNWVNTIIDLEEPDQEDSYTDNTSISIKPNTDVREMYDIVFGELFNPHAFKSLPHIDTFYKSMRQEENVMIRKHLHSEGEGSEETWLTIYQIPKDQVQKILNEFIQVIKTNPRISIKT